MDLKSFLKAGETLPEGGERRSDLACQTPVSGTGSRLAIAAKPPSESVVVRDVTPNGTVIEYEASPKRLYRVGRLEQCRDCLVGDGLNNIPPELASRCSDCSLEMVEVPSVTTVLGILNKPQLVWWGMQKGVQGVLDLFSLGYMTTNYDWTNEKEIAVIVQGEDMIPADETGVVDLLKEHKLTVNHRLDQAADRGVNVHDALEQWAKTGGLPSVSDFPDTERGYVEGLYRFLVDVDPEPERCEVMVGSPSHLFAGRFDLDIFIGSGREVTERCYPKRADKRRELDSGHYRIDLKTSKGVYDSHKLQLAAYELASVECGYPATDGQAVLHVTADGKYELVFSDAKPEQFLAVKSAYDALEEL